jgi:HAD superfamily hydrolase (TIGR01509 family)
MRLEAIIFDLDGVLIESELDYRRMRREVQRLLREAGIILEGMEDLKIWEMLEIGLERHRQRGGSEEDWRRLVQCIDEALSHIELEALDRVRVRPGAVETLEALREAGLRIGVATRSCRHYALQSLERVGLSAYIEALLARDDVEHPKPDPSHLLQVISLLDAKPSTTLYIGDTTTDLKTARGAGVAFIGLLTGSEWSRRLLEEDCRVVEELPQLLELLGEVP